MKKALKCAKRKLKYVERSLIIGFLVLIALIVFKICSEKPPDELDYLILFSAMVVIILLILYVVYGFRYAKKERKVGVEETSEGLIYDKFYKILIRVLKDLKDDSDSED